MAQSGRHAASRSLQQTSQPARDRALQAARVDSQLASARLPEGSEAGLSRGVIEPAPRPVARQAALRESSPSRQSPSAATVYVHITSS